ncbi:MAG: flagellar export chaperone FliS [Spirochaetes bacterium GWF1_51_8]|nr:MAG: flagellar export chaperone FliS [Spirochaetes bacterium GWF1_51_8]
MEGYKNYREVEIETASGLKLVVMLYSGAIKFLNTASDALAQRRLDIVNNNIIKAQDIVSELITSLNFEAGEIAHNLYSLYIYMNRRLLEANLQKNKDIIDEVVRLLNTLKEAWDILLRNQKPEIAKATASSRLNISG